MNWLLQNSIKILLLVVVSLTLTAEPSKTPLPLAGIAIQEKLRVPIFYAAVFSQHNTENNFTQNPNFPLRMEVRYIQDKFSKRQNHQLWIERILINTPRSELESLSDELLEFSRLMKHEMKKGDQLIFEYYPGSGTRVILNEVLITTFKNFEFQKALTAIWYGKRPPTIVFQQTLLSPPNQKLVKEFNQLSFEDARKREIANLFVPQQTSTKVAKVDTETAATKKPEAKKKVVKKQTKQAKKTPPKEKVANKTPPKKSDDSKKTTKKTEVPVKKSQPKVVAREKPIDPPKQAESKPKAKSQRAATTFDQIILEMKDDYVEDVKNYIEGKAKPIPPRKVRRKPKTNARILVSFEEKAGAIEIIDSKIIAGEFQPELQQVLHQSIRELKKIPLMPTPINDQQLTVEVELSFSKCKRTPSAWLCF